jgi:hypothetical protein
MQTRLIHQNALSLSALTGRVAARSVSIILAIIIPA